MGPKSTSIRDLKKHLERAVTEVVLLHGDGKDAPFEKRPGRYLLNVDGGMKDGIGAFGWVLSDPGDNVVALRSGKVELSSTPRSWIQQAEYAALNDGLDYATSIGIRQIRVYLDNQVVVDQVDGRATVKDAVLLKLHDATKHLIQDLDCRVYWVPRERNAAADSLVRRELS